MTFADKFEDVMDHVATYSLEPSYRTSIITASAIDFLLEQKIEIQIKLTARKSISLAVVSLQDRNK
jgi:hypothetical protein